MVIWLERGADLHMAQLMPLPVTVSCFSKIQIGFTFLVPAYLGKRAVKRVCVGVWLKINCVSFQCCQYSSLLAVIRDRLLPLVIRQWQYLCSFILLIACVKFALWSVTSVCIICWQNKYFSITSVSASSVMSYCILFLSSSAVVCL